MKLKNGFWVDANNNAWNCKYYTGTEAEQLNKTLINCRNLTNCSHCSNCNDCKNCEGCNDCRSCEGCNNCRNCDGCVYCSNCRNCRDCNYCSDCIYCMNCDNCSSCRDCRDCRECRDCNYCRDFQENPQRITGKRMGSRYDFPVIYWNEVGNEQCVVGCFRGTLSELEKKVKETHKNNPEHFDDYMKFIKCVRKYQKLTEGE